MSNVVFKDLESALKIGEKDFLKGLSIAVKYEPQEALAAECVVALVDPAALPVLKAGLDILAVLIAAIKAKQANQPLNIPATLVNDVTALITGSETILKDLGVLKE